MLFWRNPPAFTIHGWSTHFQIVSQNQPWPIVDDKQVLAVKSAWIHLGQSNELYPKWKFLHQETTFVAIFISHKHNGWPYCHLTKTRRRHENFPIGWRTSLDRRWHPPAAPAVVVGATPPEFAPNARRCPGRSGRYWDKIRNQRTTVMLMVRNGTKGMAWISRWSWKFVGAEVCWSGSSWN